MKVFQIGFNKCGTVAIKKRLEACGLRVAHSEGGAIARALVSNINGSRDPIDGLDFDGFTDMEAISEEEYIPAFRYFRELKEGVDGSYFILNTRPRENWIQSRLQMDDGAYAELHRRALGMRNLEEVIAHWRNEWDLHHHEVRSEVSTDRLCEIDIENDSLEKIEKFLGLELLYSVSERPVNFSLGRFGKFISSVSPRSVMKVIPQSWKNEIKYSLRVRRRR